MCLKSKNKYFSKINIFLNHVCLALIHSRKPRPLLTAKWIDCICMTFLTFTGEEYNFDMSVMHWGKQCLKGIKHHKYIHCLHKRAHQIIPTHWTWVKLVRLCELKLSFMELLYPQLICWVISIQALHFNPCFSYCLLWNSPQNEDNPIVKWQVHKSQLPNLYLKEASSVQQTSNGRSLL